MHISYKQETKQHSSKKWATALAAEVSLPSKSPWAQCTSSSVEKATTVSCWREGGPSARNQAPHHNSPLAPLKVTYLLCSPSCREKPSSRVMLQHPCELWVNFHTLVDHSPHIQLLRKPCPSYHSYNQQQQTQHYIGYVLLDVSNANAHLYMYCSYCAKKQKTW